MHADPATTLKVDPPPAPKPKGSTLGAIIALLALVALLASFSALTSLVGGPNLWLRLGLGFGVTLLVPSIVALWLRRRGGKRRRGPRTATMVLLLDVLLVGALVLIVPQQLGASLKREGHWWVERIVRVFGVKGDSAVIDGAKLGMRKLAGLLPGAEPGAASRPTTQPKAGAQTDAGALAKRRSDAGLAADGPSRAADATARPGGETVVRFKKGQTGILVPVVLEGPAGKAKVTMIFDTGASLSTLDGKTLAAIGLRSHPEDPTITTHTANGRARRRLLVLRSASMQDARVGGGLAVSHCDPCANGKVVGLLGLNFSRHFKVTVDHDGGTLTLAPKRPDPGSVYDLRNFVEVQGARGQQRGGRFTIHATLINRSPYPLHKLQLEVGFEAGGTKLRSNVLPEVPARGRQAISFSRPLKGKASRFVVRVAAGAWKIARY
jgi:hypothetical protein